MIIETRRAQAAWTLLDSAGRVVERGNAEAVIDDGGLNVGLVGASFLDVDGLREADRRIELNLWPDGRLVLEGLGRRHDSFTAELRRARNQTRVAGLLAHGLTMPEPFEGALLSPGPAAAVEVQVYPTHVTIVPADADPWQLPFGAIEEIARSSDPPSVRLTAGGRACLIGRLARRRDEFYECVNERRNAQAQLLARLTGHPHFSDGQGMARAGLPAFDSLLVNFSSGERLEGARRIVALTAGGEPRIGFVQLLDPDADGLAARLPLPQDWASFLLARVNGLVVLEILAGPAAATYVFEGEPETVNRDLQALHFRRAALALSEAEAAITPDNPHRLALRRLEPLRRLRAATRARLPHNAGWPKALQASIGG